MTGWDWSVYNSSVNAALYGKGNTPEMNRIIYGPTVFPGQRQVSGGGGVTVNVNQAYPLITDGRGLPEIQRLVRESLLAELRQMGLGD